MVTSLCIELAVDLLFASKCTWRKLFAIFDGLLALRNKDKQERKKATASDVGKFVKGDDEVEWKN